MLQMFNHGISSAALFFMVGCVYERTHTRNLADYGGLRKIWPIYAGILGISMFSSLGLPGLNGILPMAASLERWPDYPLRSGSRKPLVFLLFYYGFRL